MFFITYSRTCPGDVIPLAMQLSAMSATCSFADLLFGIAAPGPNTLSPIFTVATNIAMCIVPTDRKLYCGVGMFSCWHIVLSRATGRVNTLSIFSSTLSSSTASARLLVISHSGGCTFCRTTVPSPSIVYRQLFTSRLVRSRLPATLAAVHGPAPLIKSAIRLRVTPYCSCSCLWLSRAIWVCLCW